MSRPPAPRVLLASRGYIDRMDAGLVSIRGAQEIISMISSRRSVTKLILGHNELNDDGGIVLFKFLSSAIGRTYLIAEISLNSNAMGNRTLAAISEYIRGNKALRELFLQNNYFTGDPDTWRSFTAALNASRIELLSLTTNNNLSDGFLQAFLPLLDSPHLREAHLSAIGLTAQSAPTLIEYISSPRCRLHTLKCNGNALGFRCVKSILRAIERHNFSLLTVEMYSNNLAAPSSSDNTSEDDDDDDTGGPASIDAWKASEALLRRLMLRNAHLKRQTEKEALCLLRYARPLLLFSSRSSVRCIDCSCIEVSTSGAPQVAPTAPERSPFRALPTELQLYIMSFLAPTLSPAQRIRIYTYASSHATLPRAGLCLPGRGHAIQSLCVLDPASMPFGMTPGGGGCAGGKCAGALNSVVCHKEQQRGDWLTVVGCSSYDPCRED
ncbi:RNI-like protein [Roridomyces roridus]|uniref:RNI-like protein n=1 Tax=Roridomyces roridus TaxID=1738132 RepID=A0AAD7BT77_9AGAR|nr:RNI-like protein [Roridomyces roridus]